MTIHWHWFSAVWVYSKFLNGWHFSWVVNMTCRHVTFTWLGVSPRLSLAQRESNVVATQRTSNFSNVGSENHPIKKVAITIDTSRSHTYTSCWCKEKVSTNMKFAVKFGDFCKYIEFWVEFGSLDSTDQAWQDKYDCLLWQKLTWRPKHMSFNTGCTPGLALSLCYGP